MGVKVFAAPLLSAEIACDDPHRSRVLWQLHIRNLRVE